MTKQELMDYLQGLVAVIDFHEDLGTTKNPLITAEFERAHAEFVDILTKEQEQRDASRKRP